MGLDQTAFVRSAEMTAEGKEVVIMQWRNYWYIHYFMRKLWQKKTGTTDDEFNQETIELTLEDLDLLEHTIKNKDFAEFQYNEESNGRNDAAAEHYYGADLNFVILAKGLLTDYKDKGYKVFYNSWY